MPVILLFRYWELNRSSLLFSDTTYKLCLLLCPSSTKLFTSSSSLYWVEMFQNWCWWILEVELDRNFGNGYCSGHDHQQIYKQTWCIKFVSCYRVSSIKLIDFPVIWLLLCLLSNYLYNHILVVIQNLLYQMVLIFDKHIVFSNLKWFKHLSSTARNPTVSSMNPNISSGAEKWYSILSFWENAVIVTQDMVSPKWAAAPSFAMFVVTSINVSTTLLGLTVMSSSFFKE